MDKQARDARDQMRQLSKKEKWANFWYYYRVHVIVSIFAFIAVAFGISECVRQVDYDLEIAYYSTNYISNEAVTSLNEKLQKNIEDINFDAQSIIWIAPCYASLNDASEQTQAALLRLQTEISAGDSMGYIMDEKFFELVYESYGECFDKVIQISDYPEIREMLGLKEDTKLYWMTKALYESESDDERKIASHENAVRVEKYFEGLEK